MQELKIQIAELSPISSLEQAVTASANTSPIEAQRSLFKVQAALQTDFILADKTHQYDLMSNWADGLAQLSYANPD